MLVNVRGGEGDGHGTFKHFQPNDPHLPLL